MAFLYRLYCIIFSLQWSYIFFRHIGPMTHGLNGGIGAWYPKRHMSMTMYATLRDHRPIHSTARNRLGILTARRVCVRCKVKMIEKLINSCLGSRKFCVFCCRMLPLTRQSRLQQTTNFAKSFLIFEKHKVWYLMRIFCQQNLKLSSAAKCSWRLKLHSL